MHDQINSKLHFFSILFAGCSATFWAVAARDYFIPVSWLLILIVFVVLTQRTGMKIFVQRFSGIGAVLLIVSLFQIIFRRQGAILFQWNEFPLIYADGLREAFLLWNRFLMIFILAYLFSKIPVFEFFVFLNKIGITIQFSLLLLTTIRFIPFMASEMKKGMWTLKFRGVNLSDLKLKDKYLNVRKILKPLLFRGLQYASYSSLALEMRGYGSYQRVNFPVKYALKLLDYVVIILVIIFNIISVFLAEF